MRSRTSIPPAALAAAVALAAALPAACVSTNATMLGTASAQRAPVPESTVRLYRTAAQVPGRYEEIALVNAAANTGLANEDRMLRAMKKRAGRVGANALILDAISEPSAGAKVAGAFLGTGTERKGKAVAIYVFPLGTASDTAARR